MIGQLHMLPNSPAHSHSPPLKDGLTTVPIVPWHGAPVVTPLTPVWVHFDIGAGVRYCAIRLLWTYATFLAEFIVHDEKMYRMRHLP